MNDTPVRRIALSALVEDDRNARTHDARNLDAIRASIRKYGQVEPLVVHGSTMRVIGGNARLKVLREEGHTDALCYVYDGSEASARDLALRLNRTADLAGWDDRVLAELLQELASSGEASLVDLGFSDADLAGLLAPPPASGSSTGSSGGATPGAAPGAAPARAEGDLWLPNGQQIADPKNAVSHVLVEIRIPPQISQDVLATLRAAVAPYEKAGLIFMVA